MPNDFSGTRSLFGALGGGGQIAADAQAKQQMLYDRQDLGRATLDEKITQALLERDKRTAQQGYGGAYQRQLGIDEQGGIDLANLTIGGAGKADDMQKIILRQKALMALQGMDLAPGNAELAALDGKPLQHLTTQGVNVIANRYGEAPVLDLTQLGEAQVGATNSLAHQRDAAADLSTVKAQAGGFAPRAGGGAVSGVTSTAPGHYNVGGNQAMKQAEAIIHDIQAQGGDPTGSTPRSIARDARDGIVDVPAGNPGAEAMRWITPTAVRDVPLPTSVAPLPGSGNAALDHFGHGAPAPLDIANVGVPVPAQAPALPDNAAGVLAEAQAAIAKGADPAQVRARLQKLGYGALAGSL